MSINIAVLISGRGSNLNAIIQAIADKELDAKIVSVISNDPEAAGLTIAKQHDIETFALSHKGMKRVEHEKQILKYLEKLKVDYLVLAGYMRVLTKHFLKPFKDEDGYYRIINIHPSLLPAFPGANAYEDAFNYGVKVTGVTVHLVDEKVDHGPIIAQQPFPIFPGDTIDTVKSRGLSVEHALYPAVLQQIALEGINIRKDRTQEGVVSK